MEYIIPGNFTDAVFRLFQALASLHVNFLLSVAAAYIIYYSTKICKVPQLICKEGKWRNFLSSQLTILGEKFNPSPFFVGALRQTVLGTIARNHPKINWDEAEDLDLEDKGQVHLHWMHGRVESQFELKNRPTVILLPGLTGNNEANYILHMSRLLYNLGYRAVVFTYRGMGGKGLKTAKTYCACYTDDLMHVVKHVKTRFPDAPIMATGISLGGLILFHYLARTGRDSGLVAAMTLSVPWNPFESCKSLTTTVNKLLFNRHLTKKLLSGIENHLHMFKEIVNLDHVRESSTIHEFDERFTRRVFGFESLDHYYASAQVSNKIHDVKTPLLCLNSKDDPFAPGYSIPAEDISQSDSVALVLTDYGGHVAFLDTFLLQGPSFMDRLFAQYVQAVFTSLDADVDLPT